MTPRQAKQLRNERIDAMLPTIDQPGSMLQQLDAADLYLSDPSRILDRDNAWLRARSLVMPHVAHHRTAGRASA